MRNLLPNRKLLTGVAIAMIIAVGIGAGIWLDSAYQRKIAIREIELLGGTIYVERDAPGGKPPPLPRLERLANYVVGEWAIDGPADIVVDVHLKKIVSRVHQVGKVRVLSVFQNEFNESDIECLGKLENVSRIELLSFRDNRDAARNLQRLLPHCTVVVPPPNNLERDDAFR